MIYSQMVALFFLMVMNLPWDSDRISQKSLSNKNQIQVKRGCSERELTVELSEKSDIGIVWGACLDPRTLSLGGGFKDFYFYP